MTNYIYALHCPIADTVRYIGKTNNPEYRLATHITSAKSGKYSHYTARWLRKLIGQNLKPEMQILEELDDSENWEDRERFYIENGELLGWKLTNTNPGGEGGGFVREEDKQAWAANIKASYTQEVRAKMSERLKVALDNPETKAKQRANMKNRWADAEYRERMQAHSERINSDPEVSKLRSENGRIVYEDPAKRKNISEKLSAYYASPEGRANKIATSASPEKVEASRSGQLQNWQDPGYRERIMAAKTTPEVIAKQSAGAATQWADPEMREKMLAGLRRGQQARRERDKRTPEQEAAWREERLAKRRAKRLADKLAKSV